jgi:hypothetical protein
MREGTMAGGFDNHLIYIALALAVVATVATMPADGAQALRKIQWLLLMSAAPEAIATTVASDGTTFPTSP